MTLSLVGWMSGLSASGIVIFGWVFGLITCYKAKKSNAKLLFYMGIGMICLGGCWLGNLVDFVTILLTGKNMDNSYGLYIILSTMWLGPAIVLIIYIFAELLIPEKKWYLTSISLVICVLYEFFLFFDVMNSYVFVYPSTSGEDLIDEELIYTSPVGILTFITIISSILCGFGFLIKGIQSTGVIRKKFFFLSIALFLFFICGTLDVSIPSGIILIFVRIGVLITLWFFYLGLREEPEKTEKLKPKKEIKVEGDLFRISKRPDQITEEEVSISKEKKICLVCKGKVGKIMFMCPNCETFYCINCSEALSNLENACWVCNEPFDESKPVKPLKKDDEEVEIEISEKPQKKPKD